MTAPHGQDTGIATPVPSPGRYDIDPEGSTVEFRTRHLFGLAAVRGSFAVRRGTVSVADAEADTVTDPAANPVRTRVEVEIDAASFHTGTEQRDSTVRSSRFLDADRHPAMTFASQRLDRGGDSAVLAGMLTVRGVSRPVSLVGLAVEGSEAPGCRPGSFVARATTRIDRTEFGLTASRGLVGRYLDVSLRVVCLRH